MKFNVTDITINNSLKNHAKESTDNWIDLYKDGYIGFTELIDKIQPYVELYQNALKKEKSFIDSTKPFSEERWEVCKLIA